MIWKRITAWIAVFIFILAGVSSAWAASPAAAEWEFAGWYGGGCYPNVEFDPQVPGRVYLTSDVAGIWCSDDSGEHWRFINRGLPGLNVATIAAAPSDSNVLYAGTHKGGLARSKNGGENWVSCGGTWWGKISFERPHNYRSIAVSPEDSNFLVVGTAGGHVFYSKDGGRHWRILPFRIRPLGPHPVSVVAFVPGARDFYVASAGGLTRYSFATRRWQRLDGAPRPITDLHVSRLYPGTLYAAGQKTLWISQDGGASWRHTAEIPKGELYRLAVIETAQTVHIAAAWNQGWNGGILTSPDEGLTWTSEGQVSFADEISNPTRKWVGLRARHTALKVDPFNSRTLLRSDWWGVWRSDDSGLTWHEKIKGAPNTVGSDLHISQSGEIYVATMDNGLLKSSDGGLTYQAVFPSRRYDRNRSGHVWRVLTRGDRKVIATTTPWEGSHIQVAISRSGGLRFEISRQGLPRRAPRRNTLWKQGYPRALAVDPRRWDHLYLGIDGDDGGGLYISRDAGRHWKRSPGQPGSTKIYNALAVDPTNPQRLYWGAHGKRGGVYVSEDGGQRWKLRLRAMQKVYDLTVASDGTVYAAGHDRAPALFASSDGGRRWRLVKRFDGEGACDAICLDPRDPHRIFVGTVRWNERSGGRVYYSTDGGQHWTDWTDGLPDLPGPAAMAVHPLDGRIYVLMHHGSVYRRAIPGSVPEALP